MVANEGYSAKDTFPSTVQCMTKSELQTYIHLDETDAEWIAWGSNRLVPYRLLSPLNVTYVGVTAVCVDSSDPNPSTVNPPTLVLTSKTTTAINLSWSASPGSSPNGSIANYEVSYQVIGGSTSSWTAITPQLAGTTKTYSYASDPYTEYKFRVRLIDSTAVSSDWSNEVTVFSATDDAGTNPLSLTWAWNEALLVGGYGGEIKIEGSLDSRVYTKIEVLSESGTWEIKARGASGVSSLYDTSVSSTPYVYTPPPSVDQTLTVSQGGGYYYRYAYSVSFTAGSGTGGSLNIRATILSATDYPESELPAPLTFTVNNN